DMYGIAGPSATVSATTPAVSLAALAAPTGLTILGSTGTTATLAWTGVTGANGYRVYQAGPDGAIVPAMSGAVATTAAVVSGLIPGTTYLFAVVAVDSSGTAGAPSAVVSTATSASAAAAA